MEIKAVRLLFYSATGNTKRVAQLVGETLAGELSAPLSVWDYSLPAAREEMQAFDGQELLIYATPVYAGRIPNKLLPYLQEKLQGNKTPAVILATFGNRSFDNALAELCYELNAHGFCPMAGAAIPAQHAFSAKLATGRPDEADCKALESFAREVAGRLKEVAGPPFPLPAIPGEFPAPYYTPLGRDGKPAVFLKAKPATDLQKCDHCGVCIACCPMGSIAKDDPAAVPGVCIKCQACVKNCHTGAKYFDDPAFLSHVAMLEENYTRRAQAFCFLSLDPPPAR